MSETTLIDTTLSMLEREKEVYQTLITMTNQIIDLQERVAKLEEQA